MGKLFKSRPNVNKCNGQINISLPKRKLPKSISDNPEKIKFIKFKIEDIIEW